MRICSNQADPSKSELGLTLQRWVKQGNNQLAQSIKPQCASLLSNRNSERPGSLVFLLLRTSLTNRQLMLEST